MSNVGPRPVAEPALRLSAARAAVLAFLVEQGGPVTVQEVSASSGQHSNTVREHLEALVDLRLATRQTTPAVGRGRPAIAYSTAAQTSPLRSTREYASLLDALITRLRSMSTDLADDALAVGRAWAEDVAPAESVEELLQRMGFEPVRESPKCVRLETCPVLAAARSNPDVVCTMHLGLLRALMGEGIELEPFVEGGCRIHFPEPLPPRDGTDPGPHEG